MPVGTTLTPAQREAFDRDGFLVLPHFSSDADMLALRDAAGAIEAAYDPAVDGACAFTTSDAAAARKFSDAYFLGSAAVTRCFTEELSADELAAAAAARKAPDGDASAPLPKPPLNKIGHTLHDAHPVFAPFSHSAAVRSLLTDGVGMATPVGVQSMYIFKGARVGGAVPPHRDATFLHTSPVDTVTGLWWAVDDAAVGNGCLWALPGSHRGGAPRKMVLNADRDGTTFEGTDAAAEGAGGPDAPGWVPLEVARGGLVLLHGAVLHKSGRNTSGVPRHAYSMHVIDEQPGVVWDKSNWLQRPPELPFRAV
ncbi:hypothetical protein BU14_0375s0008 [Porphyra umbilicalis]|uniref:Fe2OG dioxygenase domain-containing protein n=1 Tax=Porphyra umbilicalis TaxID=2786 RepID=A0A1X6NWY6_PORUM|nr:hypothetical protein BU14_0375s0008 [Porphyra umbilicalis]|eukprot:OSX73121.1 hypothetical protein BU14_0375s0008 [Porphyra umbilicalis]